MKVTLLDQACELANSAIVERKLHEELRCAEWDALANQYGEQIRAYALDLVDIELAKRDAEKLKKEAA